jgi:hypothetical protein
VHGYHERAAADVPVDGRMIKRQMYGRAGFTLLRHPILFS